MSSLLREVIPLALAAAISPVIFLLQLNTLTGERPIARGAALTAGAAGVLIVVSTIGILVGDTGFEPQMIPSFLWSRLGSGLVPAAQTEGTQGRREASQHRRSWQASNFTTFALYTPALARAGAFPSASKASPRSSSC